MSDPIAPANPPKASAPQRPAPRRKFRKTRYEQLVDAFKARQAPKR